jgi:hypothetical protein
MKFDTYDETLSMCRQKSEYFKNIDFPHLSECFGNAADALAKLIGLLKEIDDDGTAE